MEDIPKINYPKEWLEKPLFNLTAEMFECVKDHNFDRLSEICDDDFGIIDINPEGGSEIMRDREGWENWFKGLFKNLSILGATTWSEITHYEESVTGHMAYSVVDFDQVFIQGDKNMRFGVIATIIWKKVDNIWKEARYHSSLKGIKENNDN